MKINKVVIVFGIVAILMGCKDISKNATQESKKETAPLKFEENWESLSKIEIQPEWFKDAKLGIYFHWGVYSVPAFDSEWYPRWMYYPDRGEKWGGEVFAHHQKTYGGVDKFNYHDFIPMFKAEQFDADNWASLFKDAGAKFAGPVAQHHDGFAMWGSKVNPWNSKDMGPKKDITKELFQALGKKNIKTIATFHHSRLGQKYAKDSTNWAGNGPDVGVDSNYPYHPDYITSTTDPKLRKLYGNMEIDEFNQYWLDQIKEVVDDYAPDIIWFDSWLDRIPENYRQQMVAHHFNTAVNRNQEPLVIHKQKDLPLSVSILDVEQGGKTEISEDYWMTDITINLDGAWSHVDDRDYKEPSLVIRNMIDVWSKKGIVLLNISPTAAGVIDQAQRDILKAIGKWIERHEEAVYETRVHATYGYGNANTGKGNHGGQSIVVEYSKNDIRFTTSKDGNTVYTYILGLPEANSDIQLEHVFDSNKTATIKNVSIVGSNAQLKWLRNDETLTITTPQSSDMNEIATVIKLEFK
ncbi:alpha-L-fucosidase [Flavivirga eckloniae]|uniref:alpha-L-fucosidase n=1 Tax=Flavivirga eckloniae TaxID=1803846 RepID=A0A2K9PKV8_9FLAO|nr:alpha-L-fucosidase [Flavivirga eckloniae]AUP77709.1 alpha-L-fucosidase [Flavivirga eckloniae]